MDAVARKVAESFHYSQFTKVVVFSPGGALLSHVAGWDAASVVALCPIWPELISI